MIDFKRLFNKDEIYRKCLKCDTIFIGNEDFCSYICKNKYEIANNFTKKQINNSKRLLEIVNKDERKIEINEMLESIKVLTYKEILNLDDLSISEIRKIVEEHIEFFYKNLYTIDKNYENALREELIEMGWVYRPKINKYRPSFAHYEDKTILDIKDDYFSCNPKYFPKKFYHPQLGMLAIEKWYRDYKIQKKWIEMGWNVFILWSSQLSEFIQI